MKYQCSRCKETKEETEFWLKSKKKLAQNPSKRYHSYCKDCRLERTRIYAARPEYNAEQKEVQGEN